MRVLQLAGKLAVGYPEIVSRLYVINTPLVVAAAWWLYSRCVASPRFAAKVTILGGQVRANACCDTPHLILHIDSLLFTLIRFYSHPFASIHIFNSFPLLVTPGIRFSALLIFLLIFLISSLLGS